MVEVAQEIIEEPVEDVAEDAIDVTGSEESTVAENPAAEDGAADETAG